MNQDRAGKTLYELWEGHAYLVATETREAMAKSVPHWAKGWVQEPLIVRSVMMPDGKGRTTPPVLAGTWSGTCGASQWLDEPAFYLLQERVQHNIRTTQVWYVNRRLRGMDHIRDLGGYRIECNQPYRHEGLCAPVELPSLTWTWEHHEAAMENIARRKGIQQLPLAG